MPDKDQPEIEGVPPEQIVFVEDEMAQLFRAGEPRMGKTNALNQLLKDMITSGRSTRLFGKEDPDLAERLNTMRTKIERDLPGLFAEMQGDPRSTPSQWKYQGRLYEGQYSSMVQRPFEGQIKLDPPAEEFPVRVGDVVRIIDTQYGSRPLPGHVVDIDGWWIYVSGPLGRKQSFFGQSGYMISSYRWILEPYLPWELRRG